MTQPLEGVRVVEFGQYIAGPLAGMLLADQGADVFHIERPGGPPLDVAANATWHRGKRTQTLDLKADASRDAARALIREADVVIENFRPGVMDRLGLGAPAMTELNPRLIYCSVPGFPNDDPRAAVPGWDGFVLAAMAGLRPWFEGATESDEPAFTALPIASTFAALHAANAVAMALLSRDETGLGQRIEVSLFAATYTALGALGFRIHRRHSGPNQTLNFVPLVRQYQCADGRWLQLHAFTPRFLQQFAAAAGVQDWAGEGLLDMGAVISDTAVAADLQERMERLFRTRPAREWETLLSAAGLCAAVCQTSAEWLRDPRALASGAIIRVDVPGRGSLLQPGRQVSVEAAPENPADIPSRQPSPRTLKAAGAGVLDGVRVLDLCIVFAGPTCGRTLAEFGADVIKIDDPTRPGGVIFHQDVNRGKRSILLDLRTEAGRDVFWRLLEDADVVVENFRQGAMERLGLGYDQVRAVRPDIIYASLNTYGYSGPRADEPGWEQLAQATTGMQLRYGGSGRPVLQPFAVLDFGTGLSAAYGVALALRQRRLTGLGQRVQTSLTATAGTIQSLFLQDGPAADEPSGQHTKGFGPLHRLYRASDGWFFVAIADRDLAAAGRIAGLESLAGRPPDEVAAFLAGRFLQQPLRYWVTVFNDAGMGAHSLRSIEQVMSDPWARSHGLALTREAPGLGLVDTIGPVAQMSRTPTQPGRPAGYAGSEGREILQEAGFDETQIQELIEAGIVGGRIRH